MNIQTLHTFMMSDFAAVRPQVEPIFLQAQERASRGYRTNVKSFVQQLQQVMRPHRMTVTTEYERDIRRTGPSYQWYPPLSAFCFEPTQGSQKAAKIQLILGIDELSNRLELIPEGWEYFRYRFYKTMLHELVHRAQFANGRRGQTSLVFRPHNHAFMDKYHLIEQRYLGEIDEVEAYAHDCVEEWYCVYPNRPLTMKTLRENFNGPRHLPSLSYYFDVFHGDDTHPAVQRLFRKVKAWNDLMTPLVKDFAFYRPAIASVAKAKGFRFALD